MAQSGRIRHKMWLGMALVVGIMAILLTGTLKGMEGYRQSLRSLDCKLAELNKAGAFQTAVNNLPAYVPRDPGTTQETVPSPAINENLRAYKLREAIKSDVGPKLEEYREALQRTLDRRPPSERNVDSQQYLACKGLLDSLETAITEETSGGGVRVAFGSSDPLPKSDRIINRLKHAVGDLIDNLQDDMRIVTHQSYRDQRVSLIILISSSVAAVVCMIGTLRFFYRRLLKPIRLLEQGVTRVARGDFEHRIDIKTGDEIESFANAYNDMTGKLHDLYRDLAQQVNERSRQLVRSERLAGVGFLAAGVAHEINNPLASIAFCGEALESRLGELFEGRSGKGNARQDREIVEKYLKMIQEEAFRCKEITEKLLTFSRGGDRKREKTDLNEIVQAVLDMVQHVPNSKGKTITFTPGQNLEAWVSSQEIKQVFLNLVVNALDSMDEGGTLAIAHAHRGDTIELSFKDSGCGMTEETLENIFEPFFTRSRTGKGTGLGLSISHRIITAHGGEIEATSAGPNQGSTFLVRLPTAEPADKAGDDEVVDPREEFVKLSEAQHRRAA